MTELFSIAIQNIVIATFLALFVWCITRILKNPPVAHLLWLLVLVKLITPPLFSVDLQKWIAVPDATPVESQVRTSPSPMSSSHPGLNPVTNGSSVDVTVDDTSSVLAHISSTTIFSAWVTIRPVLIWIWVGGAGLFAFVSGRRIVCFHRILNGTLPASERLQSKTDELAMQLGLRRSPDVRMVDGLTVPFAWYTGPRAKIVVPLKLFSILNDQQISMVLAHELSHLRRGDQGVRVIELVVSILYWWNPLVWWVRLQLHAVEEQCCDAWVAWIFPDKSHDYAESLIKAAELLLPNSSPELLASPFLSPHPLTERIEMVLQHNTRRMASRWATVGIALFAIIFISTGVQSEEDPGEKSTARVTTPINKENTHAFHGTFNFAQCRSHKWTENQDVIRTWQWSIEDQVIIWTRPNQEAVRMSFSVTPNLPHPKISLTFLDGPDKGKQSQGYYMASKHRILLWIQDPGSPSVLPAWQNFTGGKQCHSIELVPARIPTPDEQIADFEGRWEFDFYYSDWWPGQINNPPVGSSNWRWTVNGNKIIWTGMKVDDVTLSLTVDPSKSPRQIDLTFLNGPHKGKTLRGIYEFTAGNGCQICFADPDANVGRPSDIHYSTMMGHTMLNIQRLATDELSKNSARPFDPANASEAKK